MTTGIWTVRQSLLDAASRGRGFAYLGPRFFGEGVVLEHPEERARLELTGGPSDTAMVEAWSQTLDGTVAGLRDDEVCVFLLGYEAGVVVDPLSPRWPRDPRLGPDGFVRVYQRGSPRTLCHEQRATTPGELGLYVDDGARERHLARVARCQEYLHDGTLYQANLAHRVRVQARTLQEGIEWFTAKIAPREPGFAALVDDAGFGSLLSLSPECFLTWDLPRGCAAAYPVKGTRPRRVDPIDDERERAQLRRSAKDGAEHVMIVDLLRNDLGRVAIAGGVTVTALMRDLTTPSVHHLESEICAQLPRDLPLSELLKATAPGGSITGAPKSAAVDVIAELEEGPRGPYTGILGVVDAAGRGTASLLIRTWVRPDGAPGVLHVGGGIVVGSTPEAEWEETLHKASAFGSVATAGA